jgi:hypothetical protein
MHACINSFCYSGMDLMIWTAPIYWLYPCLRTHYVSCLASWSMWESGSTLYTYYIPLSCYPILVLGPFAIVKGLSKCGIQPWVILNHLPKAMMMLSANGEHLQQAACFAARVRVTIFFCQSHNSSATLHYSSWNCEKQLYMFTLHYIQYICTWDGRSTCLHETNYSIGTSSCRRGWELEGVVNFCYSWMIWLSASEAVNSYPAWRLVEYYVGEYTVHVRLLSYCLSFY